MDSSEINIIEQTAQRKYFEEKLETIHNQIFRENKPFSLIDVLKLLIEASDILLHHKDYDGPHWEEMTYAKREAKKILHELETYTRSLTT